MAQTSLKRRLAQGVGALGVLLLIAPPTAYAAMAVIDKAALAKLTEQLNTAKQEIEKLTEQLDFLQQINGQLQEQLDAIGKIGQINLPIPNLGKISDQVTQDAKCLAPDFDGLMPDLDTQNLDFGSICEGRDSFEKILWHDPDAKGWRSSERAPGDNDYNSSISWNDQTSARDAIQARRQALLKEVAASGLAQGQIAATQTAEENQKASEQLEAAADAAQTQNDRLAVLSKGTVLANRQMVQQHQLLAQLVKIQSAMLMEMSLPITVRPPLPQEIVGGGQ